MIESLGAGLEDTDWAPGQQVCALLAGGGYAEYVAVPAGQLLPAPDGVPLEHAAALPEVACTVWSNIVMTAGIAPGQLLLVHGAPAASAPTPSRSPARWAAGWP